MMTYLVRIQFIHGKILTINPINLWFHANTLKLSYLATYSQIYTYIFTTLSSNILVNEMITLTSILDESVIIKHIWILV